MPGNLSAGAADARDIRALGRQGSPSVSGFPLHHGAGRLVVVAPTRVARARRSGLLVDPVLASATVLAAVIGVVMVYTATRGGLLASGTSPTYYLKRQAVFVVLGVVVMVVMALIDYRRLEQFGMVIYGLTVLSLLAVMAIGSHTMGSTRWFSFGPVQIQPSEFAVLGLVVTVATYCARRTDGLTWRDVIKLLVMGAVPIVLVMVQPDLGTAIIMSVVLVVMLAVAGLPTRVLVMLLLGALAVVVIAVESGMLHHYQMGRITGFLDQNATTASPQAQMAIYNLHQAEDAIGAGGLIGPGLFHGAQTNLGYVPEQQTDFIFTAVGEQLGFVGSVGVLAVLGVVALRVLRTAQLSRDAFGRLLCTGVFTFIAFSTFQNAGMTMGIMPITGIPLPFISYGGTAVIAFFLGVGMVLSVYARRAR